MSQDSEKKAVAKAALDYVKGHSVIGVGSGSTVHYFIDELASIKNHIDIAVASSVETERRLKAIGICVQDLNYVGKVPIYIDGADECDRHKMLSKGGGGALTREKIIAAASEQFVCIIDSSKQVDVLGTFPLAVEVIPMARGYVAREIVTLGGSPEYREGFITDNGNIILDVHGLKIVNPIELENRLNNIVGVVTNGLFAKRHADNVLVASTKGVVCL